MIVQIELRKENDLGGPISSANGARTARKAAGHVCFGGRDRYHHAPFAGTVSVVKGGKASIRWPVNTLSSEVSGFDPLVFTCTKDDAFAAWRDLDVDRALWAVVGFLRTGRETRSFVHGLGEGMWSAGRKGVRSAGG